uniref:Uncharacterized protein n=1 Tax=Ditylenchus dipsaci TaxID=166011 RepID=A0A915DVT3_9BILA
MLLITGYNDCPGGEDELNCAECNRGSFLCSDDKKCILITKRCDGIDDCLDGSDEKDCSCQECMLHPFKTYMCSSGPRCFRLNNVCAPYSQCPNADDRDKLYCAPTSLRPILNNLNIISELLSRCAAPVLSCPGIVFFFNRRETDLPHDLVSHLIKEFEEQEACRPAMNEKTTAWA